MRESLSFSEGPSRVPPPVVVFFFFASLISGALSAIVKLWSYSKSPRGLRTVIFKTSSWKLQGRSSHQTSDHDLVTSLNCGPNPTNGAPPLCLP